MKNKSPPDHRRQQRWREDTWHVAQYFSQGLRLLVLDALAGHDRYRTGCFRQRRAGLGTNTAILRLVAHIPGNLLIETRLLISADGGRCRRELTCGNRLQDITAGRLGDGLQPRVLQQQGKALLHRIVTFQPRCVQTRGLLGRTTRSHSPWRQTGSRHCPGGPRR